MPKFSCSQVREQVPFVKTSARAAFRPSIRSATVTLKTIWNLNFRETAGPPLPLACPLTLVRGFPPFCRGSSYFNRSVQSRVVLPEPSSPGISVSYNSALSRQSCSPSEKHGILQKGVGIPVVRNFDLRDSPGKTLFQANEAIDSEFAYAPCLFDAV